MYVYVSICIYVYIYIFFYMFIYISMSVYIYIFKAISMSMSISISLCLCLYIVIFISISSMSIYMQHMHIQVLIKLIYLKDLDSSLSKLHALQPRDYELNFQHCLEQCDRACNISAFTFFNVGSINFSETMYEPKNLDTHCNVCYLCVLVS